MSWPLIQLEVRLFLSQVGRDEKGEFVFLKRGEWLESDGAIVKVQQKDEGTEISVTVVASDETVEVLERICAQGNVDPRKANLIVPNDRSFSICFGRTGNVEELGFQV